MTTLSTRAQHAFAVGVNAVGRDTDLKTNRRR